MTLPRVSGEVGGVGERFGIVWIQCQGMRHREAGLVDPPQRGEGQAALLLGFHALRVFQERILGAGQGDVIMLGIVGLGRGIEGILIRRAVGSGKLRTFTRDRSRALGGLDRGGLRGMNPRGVEPNRRALTAGAQGHAKGADSELSASSFHRRALEFNTPRRPPGKR